MIKKAVLFIIVFVLTAIFFMGRIAAQTGAGDDPEKKLETVSGKEKVELLNELADDNVSFHPQKSLDFANRALELAKEIDDRGGEAQALRHMGTAYRVLDDYPKAIEYHKKSLELFEALKNKRAVGLLLRHTAVDYWSQSNYPKALEYLERAIIIFEELDFKVALGSCYNIIGVINDDLTKMDEALKYYLKSLKINEEIDNKRGIAMALGNVGVVYRKLHKYDESLEYQEKALAIEESIENKEGIARALTNIGVVLDSKEQYPEALDYYLRSLKIKREIGNKRNIYSSLGNIANVYTLMGEYDKAVGYFEEALKINEDNGNKRGIAICLRDLGYFYSEQDKYAEALRHFERGIKIAKEIEADGELNDLYYYTAQVYEKKKDYKNAMEYFVLYLRVHDKIVNEVSSTKIGELQTIYETEKKEKEIALLEKNGEIRELILSREKFKANAFIVGFVLVLIIALLLFKKYLYLFAFWKRKNYIGHYRILGEIGSGGMGIVYKASPVMEKEKTVALKVIRDEYTKDPLHRKRFLNEARMVDQMDHPNIVKVYERGESDERLFIAMEMLQGRSLAEIIRNHERLPINHCISIMGQMVDAVAKIHSRGIVHRDLKPENIMILDTENNEPAAKLLDFGLARTQSLTRLTETGEILGTINYLPPERISHQDFSAAGDIYSLGVVFYEMFTVEKPFLGETPIDIIKQILEKEPVEPFSFRPDIPGDLNTLIMEMMNKEPGKRPSEDVVLTRVNDHR